MTDRLRLAATLAGLVGLGVAVYLTVVHYAGATPACGITHGCSTVQSSEYAKLAGVPVAVLGAVGYAAILVALWLPGEAARLAAAGLAIGGFAFSAYLTYAELFVIDAICQYCVASQLAMTILVALTVPRALRAPAGPTGSALPEPA